MAQNGKRWAKIAKHGNKWQKVPKWPKRDKNDQK